MPRKTKAAMPEMAAACTIPKRAALPPLADCAVCWQKTRGQGGNRSAGLQLHF